VRGFIVDITERKRAEETIRHLTYHDQLTGLPNGALLQERLRQAIATARRERQPVALVLMNVDRFREINHTLGHHNGDRVLLDLSRRLGDVVGQPDRVARLRGDEFALLLPGADANLARQVAAKIAKALEQPFVVERLPIEIGASIGISVQPDHGDEAEVILRRADMALQAAKRTNAGCVVYSPECDPYDPRRLAVLGELRHAIEADQLLLHYQPKVDLKTRSVVGTEALVRWRHPKHGMVPPDQFIPLAEQGGLIKPLTRWVLDQALKQCEIWTHEEPKLPVAVNLSARNLHDPQLVEQITGLLASRGVAPELLQLELTESAVMTDPVRAGEILRSLETSGVGISIDDFGTGYTSLAYLRRLPVSELKIDKSFVIGMTKETEDTAIVRSTNDLGHNLGLSVVAEGVEDQSTFELLGSFGCDAAQGYYMGRPMPPADLTRWLRESPWGISPRGGNGRG
jgi:diguanylate cyclase (GGDEF)-like protein